MDFLTKAHKLMPVLQKRDAFPLPETEPRDRILEPGESFILDFGSHLVGYLTVCFEPQGTADSPLGIRLHFAEDPCELDMRDDLSDYRGSLSSTWIQQETVYIDRPEDRFCLARRYAFRYVRITLHGSVHYRVRYRYAYCTAVTSADSACVTPLPAHTDALLSEIDRISVCTLRECMQEVFEDGPKRDRRLWMGDLYLQAKANYVTFRNNGLVLRCLYLFAGLTHANGGVSSAVFHEPVLQNQTWILHDYALFFIGTLADYYDATQDTDVLAELFPTAFRQAEIAVQAANGEGLVPPDRYFVDWCEPLDKAPAAQGIAIAMLKRCLNLAEILRLEAQAGQLREWIRTLTAGAMRMYDVSAHLFYDPTSRQISVASQMWMILAGVLDRAENIQVLEALAAHPDVVGTVTPYAMHYYVEALVACEQMDEAKRVIKSYWGAMANRKADCFWEVYVPGNDAASPYGDRRINSFCHAWSCTPTYFIRRYFVD